MKQYDIVNFNAWENQKNLPASRRKCGINAFIARNEKTSPRFRIDLPLLERVVSQQSLARVDPKIKSLESCIYCLLEFIFRKKGKLIPLWEFKVKQRRLFILFVDD